MVKQNPEYTHFYYLLDTKTGGMEKIEFEYDSHEDAVYVTQDGKTWSVVPEQKDRFLNDHPDAILKSSPPKVLHDHIPPKQQILK